MKLLLFLLLLWPLGGAPATAQPPGGYPLRRVSALPPTPQEAARLVPYRKGKVWGYADTTGVLAVAPAAVQRPALFRNGLSRNSAWVLPPSAAPAWKSDYQPEILLNAHGEYLFVQPDEFAAPGPDGRWRAYRWQQSARLPALAGWAARWDYMHMAQPIDRARRLIERHQPAGGRSLRTYQLSARYYTLVVVEKEIIDKTWAGRCGVHPRRYVLSKMALADSSGQRLTDYRYSKLEKYGERRLWYATEGTPDDVKPSRFGVLDVRGQQLTEPLYDEFSAFQGGGATVRVKQPNGSWQQGVIDSLGRYTLPLQAEPLSRPDEAGLVRRLHRPTAGPPVVQFLTRDGRPAFASYQFANAGPVWAGRAWAQLEALQGLLDARGRWVVPCQYTGLWYPAYQPDLHCEERRVGGHFEDMVFPTLPSLYNAPYEDSRQLRPDTAWLVCRRAGHYGLVSRHTGREVVPCRYDSVFAVHDGYGSFRRNGTTYFVSPQGQELAQGYYEGEYYDYPSGRLFKLHSAASPGRYYVNAPPSRWTVVDRQGRQLLPWLDGQNGDYWPQGWAVTIAPATCPRPCATLVDSTGQVVCQAGNTQLSYGRQTLGTSNTSSRSNYGQHYRFALAPTQHLATPVILRWHSGGDGPQAELLDAHLQPLTTRPYSSIEPVTPDWFVGFIDRDGHRCAAVLLSATGRRYTLPPGVSWSPDSYWRLASPFGEQGVALSEAGYVTWGGRQLWED